MDEGEQTVERHLQASSKGLAQALQGSSVDAGLGSPDALLVGYQALLCLLLFPKLGLAALPQNLLSGCCLGGLLSFLLLSLLPVPFLRWHTLRAATLA